jgi:D-glutamate cyclase
VTRLSNLFENFGRAPDDPGPRGKDVGTIDWQALENIVHRDVAGRGLAGYRVDGRTLDEGQLRASAEHLAQHATSVGIVTGFPAVTPGGIVAETDGPPGALYLARAFAALGVEVTIVVDRYALRLMEVGCDQWHLDRKMIVEFPRALPGEEDSVENEPADANQPAAVERWIERFLQGAPARRWSHLVAIERPGPSHTPSSLAAQARGASAPGERFAAAVPPAARDVCHNMRGEAIDRYTAPVHRLFERISERQLPIATIGIGDGGNEIGMGSFAWEQIVAAIAGPASGRIACRIATDFAIVGGVSNWAAYALALAVVRLCGARDLGRAWDERRQRALIEALVADAGAVDGVTLRREATVDGLSLDVYLEQLAAMRRLLGS